MREAAAEAGAVTGVGMIIGAMLIGFAEWAGIADPLVRFFCAGIGFFLAYVMAASNRIERPMTTKEIE
jgi:Co/Zn/Cd efflux system component